MNASGEAVKMVGQELTAFSEAAAEIEQVEPLLMVPAKPRDFQVLAVVPGELQVPVALASPNPSELLGLP